MKTGLIISRGMSDPHLLSSLINHQIAAMHDSVRAEQGTNNARDQWVQEHGPVITDLIYTAIPPIEALMDRVHMDHQCNLVPIREHRQMKLLQEAAKDGVDIFNPEVAWQVVNIGVIEDADACIFFWDGYDMMPPLMYMSASIKMPLLAMSRPRERPNYDMNDPKQAICSALWAVMEAHREDQVEGTEMLAQFVQELEKIKATHGAPGKMHTFTRAKARHAGNFTNRVVDADYREINPIDALNEIFGKGEPEEV